MYTLVTKSSKKVGEIFECEFCDYFTSNKYNFKKHLLTAKHKSVTLGDAGDAKSCQTNKYICNNCDKFYDSRNGLWKHKKICCGQFEESNNLINSKNSIQYNQPLQNQSGIVITPEIFLELLNQNKEMLEIIKNGTHNNMSHNNNSLNKTFNLQFFLNETCKNAMNIMDFAESIQLQLSDLETIGEVGYVEGISNIIVKNLKALDVTERPIHCADKKREVIYIKDDDKWEKEDSDKKNIKKVINKVAFKNQRLLPKFKEAHPGCNMAESQYSDQYSKIVVEAMGGAGNNDEEKADKIIRNITKEVIIDKKLMVDF